MGMPGMTPAAMTAYAVDSKNIVKSSRMTVAEYRNKLNPVSHYYDNYDVDDFLKDNSIDLKTKIGVLLGQMIANLIDMTKLEDIIKEQK